MNPLRQFSLLAIVLAGFAISAQSPASKVSITDSINASGTITVVQPAALTALLTCTPAVESASSVAHSAAATESHSSTPTQRTGYRVQIFEDNNPQTARRQAEHYNAELHARFPQFRSYVTFNSPYWRVKAGDFRSRAEAEAAMAEFRAEFPGIGSFMRVVRDKINLYD